MARSLDHHMVDVELVDDGDATDIALEREALAAERIRLADVSMWTSVPGDGEHDGAHDGAHDGDLQDEPVPGPTRARRHLIRAGVGLAAVAALVAANLAEQAAQERKEQAIAAMTGRVDSLARPLQPIWEYRAGSGSVLVDDVLLTDEGKRGPPIYRAVEVTTGQELWQVGRGPDGLVDWCGGALTGGATPMAVCWGWADRTDPETGESSPGPPTILGLSLVDGSVVFQRDMLVPGAGYGTLGADLVAADLEGDVLSVRRLDPVTGRERWATDVPLTPRVPDGTRQAFIEVSDGFVVVHGPTAAVLAGQDGRELGRWDAPAPAESDVGDVTGAQVTTSQHGFAVWQEESEDSSIPHGAWFDTEGRELVDLPGTPVEPEASDGSRPGVLLVTDGDTRLLRAVDLSGGDVLWSRRLDGGEVLLRRDGAVVVSDGVRVVSVDLRSGEERWSTKVVGLRPDAGSVTDGHHVLVAAVRNGAWLLEAVELDQGTVAWSREAPPSSVLAEFVLPGADRLLVAGVAGRVLTVRQLSVLGLA